MRALVAMSGGVDSSVAAALMLEQGYDVVGVTLKQWVGAGGAMPTAGCCTVSDAEDARRVAAQLDVPYYVLDYVDEYVVVSGVVHNDDGEYSLSVHQDGARAAVTFVAALLATGQTQDVPKRLEQGIVRGHARLDDIARIVDELQQAIDLYWNGEYERTLQLLSNTTQEDPPAWRRWSRLRPYWQRGILSAVSWA